MQEGTQIKLFIKGLILRTLAAQKHFRLLHAVAHRIRMLKQALCRQRGIAMAARIAQCCLSYRAVAFFSS